VLWINILIHKVFHSFLKLVPSEKTSIVTRVTIIDNVELIIQVGGYTPRVVLLDIGAQLVILGVQFTKKMGMFDSKICGKFASLVGTLRRYLGRVET
jgi:hypothetical protein